jgi:hypothetical protein
MCKKKKRNNVKQKRVKYDVHKITENVLLPNRM